jgi:hypothetical protein
MSLRLQDGSIDLERIRDYDRMAWMDPDAMARYFEATYAEVEASGADMRKIEEAFLGPMTFAAKADLVDRRYPIQRWEDLDEKTREMFESLRLEGGAGYKKQTASRKAVDPLVLDLMELADTCKDFGPMPKGTAVVEDRVNYIEWCMRKDPDVPVALPSATIDPAVEVRPVKLMEVARKNKFCRFMFATKYLLFGKEYVLNPLFGKDFTKGQTRVENGVDVDKIEKSDEAPCNDCVLADLFLFTDPGTHMKELWLNQVAEVSRKMRAFFRRRELAFVCDTPSYLMRVLMNLEVCANLFAGKYKVMYGDTRRTVQVEGLAEVIARLNESMRVQWSAVTCDATLLDPADHDFGGFDERETGAVFHKGSVARVNLLGCRTKPGERQEDSDEDYDGDSDGEPVRPQAVRGYDYRIVSERERIDSRVTVDDANAVDNSTSALGKIVETQSALSRYTVSNAANFALKRAGDWGMIEHCARYDHGFVTADKLAAAYARAKGVCVMYLDDHRSTKTVVVDGRERSMLHYSISMCGSHTERSNMERAESRAIAMIDPAPARIPVDEMSGGSGRMLGLQVILCVVVAVCAFV